MTWPFPMAQFSGVGVPAAPTGLTAVAVSISQIDLAWTDNSANEDAFLIERSSFGETGPFLLIDTVGPGVTSYQDDDNGTGLNEGGTYWYRVFATNGSESSAPSNVASDTTFVNIPADPSGCAFTTLVATAADPTTWINEVTWVDNSTNEDGFAVERSINGGSFAEIEDQTTVNAEQYDDVNVVEHDQYAYRVRAMRLVAGSTVYSNNYSTSATARTPLAAPDALVATVISSNSVKLDWNDNTFTGDRVKVFREGTEIADIPAVSPDIGGGANSFTDNLAPSDSLLDYEVRAHHAATGNQSQMGATTDTVETPADDPSGVTASDDTECVAGTPDLQILVDWTNGAASAGWTTHVQRDDPSLTGWFDMTGSAGIPLAQQQFTHEDPIEDLDYQYRVRHEHTDGRNTAWVTSNLVSANSILCGPENPPANLVASIGKAWEAFNEVWEYDPGSGYAFDPALFYYMKTRVIQVKTAHSASSIHYSGVEGLNSAGQVVNAEGVVGGHSDQHYFPSQSRDLEIEAMSVWKTFIGYWQGTDPAGTGPGGQHNNPADPGTLVDVATDFRPLNVMNYPAGGGGIQRTALHEIGYFDPATGLTTRVFRHNFDSVPGWTRHSGSGTEASVIYSHDEIELSWESKHKDADGFRVYRSTDALNWSPIADVWPAPGRCWQADGDGNYTWRYEDSGSNIPYDDTKLYRIRVRARQTAAPTNGEDGFYCGVLGVAADGTTLVNANGADSDSSQHYVAADDEHLATSPYSVGEWTEFKGYFSGHGTYIPDASDIGNPSGLHANVEFMRPLVIMNYNGGDGIQQVDMVEICEVDASDNVLEVLYRRNFNAVPTDWIQQASSDGTETVEFHSLNNVHYRDTGRTPGTEYFYRVKTLLQGLESDFSNEASAIPPSPLAQPTNLNTTSVSSSQVDLEWNDNEDIEEYEVYRDGVVIATGNFSNQVGTGTASYSDTTVSPGTSYDYKVRAVQRDPNDHVLNFSAESNSLNVSTDPDAPSNVLASDTTTCQTSPDYEIRVSWSPGTSGSGWTSHVQREHQDLPGSWSDMPGSTGITSGTNVYDDESPTEGILYKYRVRHEHSTLGNTAWVETGSAVAASNPCPGLIGISVSDTSFCSSGSSDNRALVGWATESGWNVHIEREVNGGSWTEIGGSPFGSGTSSVTDTAPSAGDSVRWRGRYERNGHDEFDNMDTSGTLVFQDECQPEIQFCQASSDVGVTISWTTGDLTQSVRVLLIDDSTGNTVSQQELDASPNTADSTNFFVGGGTYRGEVQPFSADSQTGNQGTPCGTNTTTV